MPGLFLTIAILSAVSSGRAPLPDPAPFLIETPQKLLGAQLGPSMTSLQARAFVKARTCAHPVRPEIFGKFEEIDWAYREGRCWVAKQLIWGRHVKTQRFPQSLETLEKEPSFPKALGFNPLQKDTKLDVKTDAEGALLITQLTAEDEYLNGIRYTYRVLTRGDFTGDEKEDLLLWKRIDSPSGTYAMCEVLLVDRSEDGALRVRNRTELGRCE